MQDYEQQFQNIVDEDGSNKGGVRLEQAKTLRIGKNNKGKQSEGAAREYQTNRRH
jgi:hypothetical protein